jgi:hypothetical protein
MARSEDLTRDAARAIGLMVADTARWDVMMCGFQLRPATPTNRNAFAPLGDPGDAYMLEDKLCISVTYKLCKNNVMVLHVSSLDCGGAVMHAVQPHEDRLTARMYAVTQYAALYALMMEDEVQHVPV